MQRYILLILIVLLSGAISPVEAITINWADVVSDSNVSSAASALGKPDGFHASFYDTSKLPLHATYSGFSGSQDFNYSNSGFATLFGINEATLAMADFFSVEVNGGLNSTYESGLWVFSDGNHYFSVDFDSTNPGGLDAIIGYGSININDYANFFGFTNPITPGHSWAFLLFDIDGNSDVNISSNNFRVTLTAANAGSGFTDPDPDVMGRIAPIPEPTTLSLLGLGLLGFAFKKKKTA